jgi:hypothetical protein
MTSLVTSFLGWIFLKITSKMAKWNESAGSVERSVVAVLAIYW